jgi:hypothetical protein
VLLKFVHPAEELFSRLNPNILSLESNCYVMYDTLSIVHALASCISSLSEVVNPGKLDTESLIGWQDIV